MTEDHPNSAHEDRLNDVLLAYLEAGAADAEELLHSHPDLAGELADFIACRQSVESIAAPLRQAFRTDPEAYACFQFHSSFGSFFADRHGDGTPAGAPPNPGTAQDGREGWPQLGDFRLVREIGRGGMGIVYEAEQLSLGRRVAVKVLPLTAGLDSRQLQRFKNEAQAAAALNHPHIVPVHLVGSEGGAHYYAMQLIEGRSLADLLRSLRQHPEDAGSLPSSTQAPPSATQPGLEPQIGAGVAPGPSPRLEHSAGMEYIRGIAELGMKAARALGHAHQEGIIHRDIKPANLLLDVRGQLWITDFGLALFQSGVEITRTGELVGTLRYMSPEQALGKRPLVDHRTDIYSLGATLYELLTLEPIFDGRESYELLRQIATQQPRLPRAINRAIPVDLETILLKATAKNPSERYTDAVEMAEDLASFLEGKPIRARRPGLLERAGQWARRHRRLVAAALGTLLIVAGALAVVNVLLVRAGSEVRDAYLREQERTREALEQRARAEQTFRQAQRAMNLFIELSEEELLDRPQLFELRMKLLETALAYYQDFSEQHQGDPATESELLDSRARIERILRDRSTLQHLNPLEVLAQKGVQDELHLSEAQRKQAAAHWAEVAAARRTQALEQGKQTGAARRQQALELSKHCERVVAEILGPAQRTRLQQISWQCLGPYAFCNPTVIEALGLGERQQHEMHRIRTDPKLRIANRSQLAPEELRRQCIERRQVLLRRTLELLTPAQRSRWEEMTGKPLPLSLVTMHRNAGFP